MLCFILLVVLSTLAFEHVHDVRTEKPCFMEFSINLTMTMTMPNLVLLLVTIFTLSEKPQGGRYPPTPLSRRCAC